MSKSSTSLPKITPSSVGDLACNKKFHELRVLGNWPKANITSSALFGTALHAVLKEVYDAKNGTIPNLAGLDVYARRAFFAIDYSDKQHREEDMARCIEMMRNYVAQDSEEDIEGTIAVEAVGTYAINRNGIPLFDLSAKLDRVIVRKSQDQCLIVRDYKTGKPRIDLDAACVQLWVAKLMYPDFRSYELEIDWIGNDGVPKRDFVQTKDVKRIAPFLIDRATSLCDSTAEHPAEPGDACFYCPLRESCQTSKQANIDTLEGFSIED